MTKVNPNKTKQQLKQGLVRWAHRHNVTPAKFQIVTGYTYPTAWSLIRGKAEMTPEALGRFTFAFGTDAAAELLELAKLPNGIAAVDILGSSADFANEDMAAAKPVITVTLK